jgi:hypothetical protein
VSSGPRAALPRVAGFTQCHHRQPGSGIDSDRERVVGGVTGLTQQCLDREVDPAAASRAPTPYRQRAGSPARAPLVPNMSSAGTHQDRHYEIRVPAMGHNGLLAGGDHGAARA